MLKSLVGPRTDPNEHIEAVTAERDFFREKYAAQMNEMEALKNQLRENQRLIDRLRKQVLDLEMDRSSGDGETVGVDAVQKEKTNDESSSNPLDSMTKHGKNESVKVKTSPADENKNTTDSTNNTSLINKQSTNNEDELEKNKSHELKEDVSFDKDEDEADRIRANAERLLEWSNYQSRRSSLPPSDAPSGRISDEGVSLVCVDTNLNRGNEQQQSLSLSSPALNVEANQNNSPNNSRGGGKISKFLNNLKDIIDPPFTDSDDDRDESSDEESRIDHRSFEEKNV